MFPAVLVVRLFVWLLATLAHVLLTRRTMERLTAGRRTLDDVWFDTTLAAVGTLAVVVHLVAASVGLTLWTGVLGLGLWHLLLWTWTRRAPAQDAPAREHGPVRILEVAAVGVLAAIVIGWVDWSAWSTAVVGTDAAGYHVPVAVNLAMGASPLGLPATQHLYPMATSALAAWFLSATGDVLLVDATMLLPFLLLASSIALLFRLATGASGLAWSAWFVVALCSTPMLRAASLMSADLLFAAAFAALLALGVRMWARGRAEPADVLLTGLAAGLLVGSKTTGIAAAVLLGASWIVAVLVTRRPRRAALGPVSIWIGAAAVAVGAGGIWLARNWMLFGSPFAPNGLTIFGVEILAGPDFEPTTYLSVLGDVQNTESYSLGARTVHFVREWFGAAYLPFLMLAVLVPLDAAAGWRRGLRVAGPRLLIVGLTLGAGVPLVWMLTGAPWTSLEWTRGHSLRYALPVAVLLPAISFIGLFPGSWPWYRRPWASAAAGSALVAGSLWLLVRSQTAGDLGPPFVHMIPLVLGCAAALAWLVTTRARRRLSGGRAAAVVVLIAVVVAPTVTTRGADAQAAARSAAPVVTEGTMVRNAVLDAERREDMVCDHRRFLLITRFDEPLALQSPTLDAVVLYAARDVASAESIGPLSACDYVIATRPVLATERGEALLQTFFPSGRTREIGTGGRFVVLAGR